mmetsp:Transcript_387/g.493  ORF Transcript_387/g.493 Transcript_387/m.493 type:complete len:312 (-) Transcript_387:199-1134(-)
MINVAQSKTTDSTHDGKDNPEIMIMDEFLFLVSQLHEFILKHSKISCDASTNIPTEKEHISLKYTVQQSADNSFNCHISALKFNTKILIYGFKDTDCCNVVKYEQEISSFFTPKSLSLNGEEHFPVDLCFGNDEWIFLSDRFKSQVLSRFLGKFLAELYTQIPGFSSICHGFLDHIFSFIPDVSTLISLSMTGKDAKQFCGQDTLWEILLRKDFPEQVESMEREQKKARYKRSFCRRKVMLRRQRNEIIHHSLHIVSLWNERPLNDWPQLPRPPFHPLPFEPEPERRSLLEDLVNHNVNPPGHIFTNPYPF